MMGICFLGNVRRGTINLDALSALPPYTVALSLSSSQWPTLMRSRLPIVMFDNTSPIDFYTNASTTNAQQGILGKVRQESGVQIVAD